MITALRERLGSRIVFVVGKGGVGKTTTASALALSYADSGEKTYLISTDPAHSLGDVFEQQLTSDPQPSRCTDKLILEQHDARMHAERWLSAAHTALRDVLERGTYLDSEDADRLLNLAVPGVDEIMGALRLVELYAQDWKHIVVDTAPTGHMLRLLEAANSMSGWIAALRAMSAKAGAVASALVRQEVVFAADHIISDLERATKSYEEMVLRRAQFVVVTRAGEVVEEETRRLQATLKERKLDIAAIVHTGKNGADPARITVPLTAQSRGCDALRKWGTESRELASPAGHLEGPPARDWIERLDERFILFVGKGGVGKSTCASAAAVAIAKHRHVKLFSADPAGSLHDIVGSVSEPNLEVAQVNAEIAFEKLRGEYQDNVEEVFGNLGFAEGAALDRRVAESIWDMAPPGVDEIFSMLELTDAASESDDMIVLDTAPTGHLIRLLEMPAIAMDWARVIMRLLLKYHAVAALDDAARGVLGFARGVRALSEALHDPAKTAIIVVTLPEPVVLAETERLIQHLGDAGFPVAATLVNRANAGPTLPTEIHTAGRVLLAPTQSEPPIGRQALESFLSHWTLRA